MSRRKLREDWTAREIIADVTASADQQHFANELRRALTQLDEEPEPAEAIDTDAPARLLMATLRYGIDAIA